MKENIEKALKNLESANFQGYFAEMDRIVMSAHLQSMYAELKSKFIQGIKTHDFSQQLAVFAKEASGKVNSESLKNETAANIYHQTAYKIYNIDNATGSTFN